MLRICLCFGNINPNSFSLAHKDPDLNGDVWSSSEDEEEEDENNLESVISKSIRWNDDAHFGLGGGGRMTQAHTLPRHSNHILLEKERASAVTIVMVVKL